MSANTYIALAILIIAACTWFTRAVPYLLFGGRRFVPAIVRHLAVALPEAIMVVLVIYCLRNASLASTGGWLPQLAAVGLVVLLQIWKKNAMLSIFAGTAVYMALIRLI
jgi:branched-subunit amino acid transport protein AzlD